MNPASIAPSATNQHEIGPGHVLGRYELLLPIAAGGMAMVWAARLKGTRGFQKIVAVKTMLPKLSEDDQFEKMFLDEASLASKVRHPNAVEILDLGEQDGVLFLAMEWIDGVPLNTLMKVAKRSGGAPPTVAIRIVMQASAGLHAAHELTDGKGKLLGLVHRDISPQNVLVTYDGVAKVVDFGVAKATALGDGATQAGQLKGKVSYMAPEQVRGDGIDRRADVFAMGIVLYALTTGKHPFRKESEGATLFAITAPEPVVAPRKFMPDYPEALQEVVLKALEKDRSLRYQSASELLRALDKALPAAARGSEEEVGAFVQSLFGEQRRKSQEALADALDRADKHQLSKTAKFVDATLSGQSGVSGMSTVGVAASLAPPHPPPSELDVALAGGGKRFIKVAFVGGLGIAGALVALLWSLSGKPADPAAEGKPAESKPAAAPPVEARSPAAVDPNALPVEPSASSATGTGPPRSEPPRKAAPPAAKSPPPPPAKTVAPAASAPATVKPSWKHDPGF
ncbi:MAG: serine/threonine protein kinase [Myxococcales bacterium]|nr:MAG: serine/threonine protein kinase [Myxococcales bacterium]